MFINFFLKIINRVVTLVVLLMPILGKLNFNYLLQRITIFIQEKINLFRNMHRDFDEPHTVALYSLNKNNGFTYFEDTKEKIIG